jgi:choline dehydrogenase-like flavoprotein
MSEKPGMYDAVILGAGISGSFIAESLVAAGLRCLLLEAGRAYARDTYPDNNLDLSSQLYWGGGIELARDGGIGFLRPKCVGGGSIVNQALLDRFDDLAFDAWRDQSGVEFLQRDAMDPDYDDVADRISIREVPQGHRNGNAEVFRTGFQANGWRCAPLERAQGDCRFGDGNSCIVCLGGCPIESKQSTPSTVLRRALAAGLELRPRTEVRRVQETEGSVRVDAVDEDGRPVSFQAGCCVLAAGAIGNSALLLRSTVAKSLPALGTNFFTHPQYMLLGIYDEPVESFLGPLQNYKSDEPIFRRAGFKLENVFAPPTSIAMLVPGFGVAHQEMMLRMRHIACVEVAVRDTRPGRIRVDRNGRPTIDKSLCDEDRRRRDLGMEAIRNIFHATGARDIIEGGLAIGLHLMGGCAIGVDGRRAVVDPSFRVHGTRRLFAADSSVFPNAPGINPSYTVMALAVRAAKSIIREVGR